MEDNVRKMETQLGQWGAKVDALTEAARDKWQTIKTGVSSAWYELEVAFKKLTHKDA